MRRPGNDASRLTSAVYGSASARTKNGRPSRNRTQRHVDDSDAARARHRRRGAPAARGRVAAGPRARAATGRSAARAAGRAARPGQARFAPVPELQVGEPQRSATRRGSARGTRGGRASASCLLFRRHGACRPAAPCGRGQSRSDAARLRRRQAADSAASSARRRAGADAPYWAAVNVPQRAGERLELLPARWRRGSGSRRAARGDRRR